MNKDICQIDPENSVEEKIVLSDIAEEIFYIPLESSYPIENILTIKLLENLIYIRSLNMELLSFTRDGKISKKIGTIGRGPGEYLHCISFAVDEYSKSIYIKDLDETIKIYSKSGNFIRSLSLKRFEAYFFSDIELSDSKLFAFEYVNLGHSKYNWVILDTLGNLIRIKFNSIPIFVTNMGGSGGIFKYDNKISYWNYYSDTIFSILPDLSNKPSYLFSHGEYRIPVSEIVDVSKYLIPRKIIETNHYLFFEYFDRTNDLSSLKVALTMINKNNNRSSLTYLETERTNYGFSYQGGILNDLDGGPEFNPISYYDENNREYLIGFFNPYQIKKLILIDEFKESSPKYPEKKEELEKLANSLKETDNPVLMIVRLKK